MPDAVQDASSIVGDAYVLTWQKDPRYRARDPFQTVLHTTDAPAGRKADVVALPRTPGEEAAFVARADACVKEAAAALDEADYSEAKSKIAAARQMAGVNLVTEPARAGMAEVKTGLADVEARYGEACARAALTRALQLAALMQAYFDGGRYGEVVSADAQLAELDTDEGLKSPEVAGTAQGVLARCAELKRRASIHLEFGQKDLKIDAVSYYPDGRSFAIVNGEVYGEGGIVMPELLVASVSSGTVAFSYKGEQISLGLSE